MACCMEGYIWIAPINWAGRILMAVSGLLLITPSITTDIIGAALTLMTHIVFIFLKKRRIATA